MDRVSFVVVNYNSSRFTEALIQSLERQEGLGESFEINLYISNNSDDPSDGASLRSACSGKGWIHLVESSDNPGYFGGLNRGLDRIPPSDRSWVVIGNNDLDFRPGFVRALLGRRYPAEAMAICPDVITADGFHQNPHIPVPRSWFRTLQFDLYFSHYYVACIMKGLKRTFWPPRKNPDRLVEGPVHMGIGACYILTPAFFCHYDSLQCPVFLYGEEAFISDQIHRAGGILWFDPALVVDHAESATVSKLPRRSVYNYERAGYPLYRDLC